MTRCMTRAIFAHRISCFAVVVLGLCIGLIGAPVVPARGDGESPAAHMLAPIPPASDSPDPAASDLTHPPAYPPTLSNGAGTLIPRAYVPVITRPADRAIPPADKNDPLAYVNYFRALAGVPLVAFDPVLNDNCWQHTRYMAEENHLTHDQRSGSPWATPAGQACAQRGNVWLGGASSSPIWTRSRTIESWMESTGHRLWLLYPTTPVFGYGFYTAANNRTGAALDVLSRANLSADATYAGWLVRYPAPGQTDVPTGRYAITLLWPYFGPSPTVGTVRLTDASGTAIAFTVSTALPVGHKGIEIKPTVNLPANTTVNVNVSGTYANQTFDIRWSFSIGG